MRMLVLVRILISRRANTDIPKGEFIVFRATSCFLVRNSIDVHGIDCSKQHREMKREFSGTVEYKMRTSKCHIGKQFLVSLF